jgi:hypothetical protein
VKARQGQVVSENFRLFPRPGCPGNLAIMELPQRNLNLQEAL